MALRNILLMTKEMRLLLQSRSGMLMRAQQKSNLTPTAGWFGEMFTMDTIKEYWEIIPVIVAGAFAAMLPIVHIGCMCYKSNDVRFWPGRRMLLEKHQYIIDGAKPKCSKYIVINEKCEWPCGLIKALKEEDSCEEDNCNKMSFAFWRRGNKTQAKQLNEQTSDK